MSCIRELYSFGVNQLALAPRAAPVHAGINTTCIWGLARVSHPIIHIYARVFCRIQRFDLNTGPVHLLIVWADLPLKLSFPCRTLRCWGLFSHLNFLKHIYYALTRVSLIFALIVLTISSRLLPGWKTAATPASSSIPTSGSGIIPPQ